MGPIHVRPVPPYQGVESAERGPVIGCELVIAEGSIRVCRYADEEHDAARARVDLSNAMLTLGQSVHDANEGR